MPSKPVPISWVRLQTLAKYRQMLLIITLLSLTLSVISFAFVSDHIYLSCASLFSVIHLWAVTLLHSNPRIHLGKSLICLSFPKKYILLVRDPVRSAPSHLIMSPISLLSLSGALAFLQVISFASAASGTGSTTRYWDCCKPSCAWNDISRLGVSSPVKSCDINDNPLAAADVQSGCAGGSAYTCSDQSPWAVSDSLAYGFAAVSAASPLCCQCYELTFTSTSIKGKKMVVQATNTGGDVGSTQFDIAVRALVPLAYHSLKVIS